MANKIIQTAPVPVPKLYVDNGDGSFSEYIKGSFTTLPDPSATGTQSSVALTGADQLVLAANASRLGFTIENDSATSVYILLASGTASSTVKSFTMLAGDIYESPGWGAVYSGAIRCFSLAASGSLRVVEYT